MADLYFMKLFFMQLVYHPEEEYTLDFMNERFTLELTLFIEIAENKWT